MSNRTSLKLGSGLVSTRRMEIIKPARCTYRLQQYVFSISAIVLSRMCVMQLRSAAYVLREGILHSFEEQAVLLFNQHRGQVRTAVPVSRSSKNLSIRYYPRLSLYSVLRVLNCVKTPDEETVPAATNTQHPTESGKCCKNGNATENMLQPGKVLSTVE